MRDERAGLYGTPLPRGWAALVALGPIRDRIDSRCLVCQGPAVVGTPAGWRCAAHPPLSGEWGHGLDWTPRPELLCGRRCYCGRHPQYQPARHRAASSPSV